MFSVLKGETKWYMGHFWGGGETVPNLSAETDCAHVRFFFAAASVNHCLLLPLGCTFFFFFFASPSPSFLSPSPHFRSKPEFDCA